jgi:hypothetical protein
MLCQACLSAFPQVLIPSPQRITASGSNAPKPYSKSVYAHHQSLHDLEMSAARGCVLCQFLRDLFPFPAAVWKYGEMKGASLSFESDDRNQFQYVLVGKHRSFPHKLAWTCESLPDDKYGSFDILPLCRNPASTAALKLAKEWIETCVTSHEGCRKHGLKSIEKTSCKNDKQEKLLPKYLTLEETIPFAPTRLLNVEYEKYGDVISLMTTTPGFGHDYVALSYCWGGKTNNAFVLTSDNLSSYQGGITINKLPRTL